MMGVKWKQKEDVMGLIGGRGLPRAARPCGSRREASLPGALSPLVQSQLPFRLPHPCLPFKCLELHQWEKLLMVENQGVFRTHFVPLHLACEFLGRPPMPQSRVFALLYFLGTALRVWR